MDDDDRMRGALLLLGYLLPCALSIAVGGSLGRLARQQCKETVRARCAANDELAGPLAGEFWAELWEEAEAEADRLDMEIDSIAFVQGSLRVLANGDVDQLQALNQALSSFLDTAEGDARSVLDWSLPISRLRRPAIATCHCPVAPGMTLPSHARRRGARGPSSIHAGGLNAGPLLRPLH